jgi:hypothetical protein
MSMASFVLALLFQGAAADYGTIGFDLDANGCVTSYDPNVDYFPPARRALMGASSGVVHEDSVLANDFSISYHKTYKVLRNLGDATRTPPRPSEAWVLHQCGTPEVYEDLPADLVGDTNITVNTNITTFSVPVSKWSTGKTVPISFLEEIGMGSHAAIVDTTYMSSSCGQKLVSCGVITAKNASDTWATQVIAAGSEVHFTDNFGTGKTGLDIDVTFDASSDPGMLNRAEWLKFGAAFFNKEAEANHVFDGIRSRFTEIVDHVLAARLAGASSPRSAFISNYAEAFDIDNTAYKNEVIFKAGGKTVDHTTAAALCPLNEIGNKYSCPNAAALKEVLKTLDAVFDEAYPALGDFVAYTFDTFKTRYQLSAADVSSGDYPFLTSSRVYRTDKRLAPATPYGDYGTDFFESAIPHADSFLNDVAKVLVPNNYPTYTTRFIRDIAAGEAAVVVGASACDDPFAVCPGETAPPPPPAVYNFCERSMCLIPAPVPPSPPPSWEEYATAAGWGLQCTGDPTRAQRRTSEALAQRRLAQQFPNSALLSP